MGLTITAPGVICENPLGYAKYPYSDTLRDLFYLTDNFDTAKINKVSGRAALSVVGTGPTGYHEGYATFGGPPSANYLAMVTAESEFVDVTRLGVFRFESAFAGTNDWRQVIGRCSNVASGIGLYQNAAVFADGTALRQAATGLPTPPHDRFWFGAMTFDAAAKTIRAYRAEDGEVIAAGVYVGAAAAVRAGGPLQIGGSSNLGVNNPNLSIAMVAQHQGVLPLEQLQAIMTYERDRLIGLGLDVG